MFVDVIKSIYTTPIYNDFKSEVISIDEIPSKSEDVDWYEMSVRIFNDLGDSRVFHERFFIPKTSRGESTFGGRRQTGIYSAQLLKAVRVYRDEVSWRRLACKLIEDTVTISTEDYEKHEYHFQSFLKYFGLYDKYSYWFLPKYLKNYSDEIYEQEKDAMEQDILNHEIPDRAIKKLRLWMKNPDLPNKLTVEIVEIIMHLIDNFEDYIDLNTPLDFVFMDVFAGLANELQRGRANLRRFYSFKFNKYNKVFLTDLQNVINHYFNMRDADIRSLQSPIDTNALSVTTQSDKIYFVKRSAQTGDLDQMRMYNKYFIGFIDPIKTVDGAKVNIKNEISRDAKIDQGTITITVYDKNFGEVELDSYEYLTSVILTSDHVDYDKNTIFPINGKYEVFQFGEYREIPESQESLIDYYRKQDSILTRSTSMIPFINKTHQTRGMLGSHMLEQAIPVIGSKPSLVHTGMGKQVYYQTPLNQQSPVDGIVEKVTEDYVVIGVGREKRLVQRYDDYNTANHTTNKFFPEVTVGQEVKKGDNIFVSNSFRHKDLSLGCELLAAYTTFYALEHEDAIVLSQSAANRFAHPMVTTISIPVDRNYECEFDRSILQVERPGTNLTNYDQLGIIKEGTHVKYGDILVLYKSYLTEKNSEYARLLKKLARRGDTTLDRIPRLIEVKVPVEIEEGTIKDIKFYPVNFRDWESREDYVEIKKEFSRRYDEKRNALRETLGVEPTGVDQITIESEDAMFVLEIRIEHLIQLKESDKMCNRYGSKGVVSRIVPDDKMLRTKDGRIIDIIVSPLSVISRINMSQLYESMLGLISVELYKRLKAYIVGGAADSRERDFLTDIVKKLLPTRVDTDLRKLYEESRPYDYIRIKVSSFDRYYTDELLNSLKTALKIDDHSELFDPISNKWVRNKIRIGYQEFLRLHFIAEDKMKVTGSMFSTRVNEGLVLGYGKRRRDGQSIGEQESWALMAHGAQNLLEEFSLEDESKGPKFMQTLLSLGIGIDSKEITDD